MPEQADSLEISVKLSDSSVSKMWIDWQEYLMHKDFYDWGWLDRERFYKKYPSSYVPGETKVTLDEADKQPGPKTLKK